MGFCKIEAKNLHFSYGRENILRGLDFEVEKKDILIIKGPNGSGKSTLIKILAGLLTLDKGKIEFYLNKKKLEEDDLYYFIGFCSVEQNLYEELTIEENLMFLSKLKGLKRPNKIEDYLEKADLLSARRKFYKNLSSGMKQKVKIISSVLHEPFFLFLDEPGTNLDDKGFKFLSFIIEEQKERGLCLIASNNEKEFVYGNKSIDLSK